MSAGLGGGTGPCSGHSGNSGAELKEPHVRVVGVKRCGKHLPPRILQGKLWFWNSRQGLRPTLSYQSGPLIRPQAPVFLPKLLPLLTQILPGHNLHLFKVRWKACFHENVLDPWTHVSFCFLNRAEHWLNYTIMQTIGFEQIDVIPWTYCVSHCLLTTTLGTPWALNCFLAK